MPSAPTASTALSSLRKTTTTHLTVLSAISSSAFVLAYALSPSRARHPYLLWSALFVGASSLGDFLLQPVNAKTGSAAARAKAEAKRSVKSAKEGRPARAMDASYEVVGDSDTPDSERESEVEEEVNGEEVRSLMEAYVLGLGIRGLVSGAGFVMSVVGIWGDGA